MAWHQLSIITDKETTPEVSDFFSELGAVSVTYMDAEDQPIYELALRETKIWQLTKVIALFELDAEPERVRTLLFSRFKNNFLQNWYQEILADQVWERTWMDHYQPMKFGDSLWVCPTGQEKNETDTVCLTLDPGLAFGTGTHPTTALCLEWLANHELSNKTIIDYGCGSGILAIAALLLGAKQAHAIDIDPQAIEVTHHNAKKNQVENKLTCYLSEQFNPFQADIVLANILAQPLCDLSEPISKLIKTKGKLVLSGILNEQAESVTKAYQVQNIQLASPVSQEEWCLLSGSKST
ncbi:MAG: 50S ribosomal protein L11 methyltransferase [Methylococcales symbiont of Iophon sp. n. MRB-2018]|nr:MAG: 50S ribosomal protein L11 methyltransferase [Methylococcales symbiont of Iophon sp. n. MRB-2018]KAF3979730.1 MAG: 50S ribosomal protein L11 methyltransferase [Methylococcales symbiont of Iophon sp. n. MRB-2018]